MKKIERFMFVIPNTRWFGKRYWLWFNPSVPILTPILKNHGLEVQVLEANIDNLTPEQMKKRVEDYYPEAVGISNMSLEYWKQPHFVAKTIKEIDKNITTIMGGVHATTLPERVMEDPNMDYIILSEGEERLPKLISVLSKEPADFSKLEGVGYRENGKVILKPPIGFIENLDSLPIPNYKMFDWNKVMNNVQKASGGIAPRRLPAASMITSRGCPNRCCFCAAPVAMGNKIRYRSPENVLKELDMLVQDYGAKEITFMDDSMYGNKNRALEIVRGIKKRNYDLIWKNMNIESWNLDYDLIKEMKESGCYQITISPESGNERVLKKIIHKPGNKDRVRNVVKICKELDIEIEADWVIGFPGETWEEIRDTTNFADELDVDVVKFAIATPFPKTELYRIASEGGYLSKDFNFYSEETLGFAHGFIETPEFTPKELEMLRCYEWDRINFKNQRKKERYSKMHGMSVEEVDEFRKATRKTIGLYFVDQIKNERKEEIDKVKFGIV